MGLLEKETIWKDHYYINKRLFTLLSNVNMWAMTYRWNGQIKMNEKSIV
jgi:hypothetical protein